uniref:PolyA_pol_RNAbd domain-containing protein n=1 Tax=Ascaris lumbricoides TaxID=6252 RepID=A0A0M3HGG7_ASCLU
MRTPFRLISTSREWARILAIFGSDPTVWSHRLDVLIKLVEILAHSKPTLRNLNAPIPIARFFDSQESAIEFLTVLTGIDGELARNIYEASVTPLFGIRAYQEISSLLGSKSLLELPLSEERFTFLCDEKIRKQGIIMPAGLAQPQELCNVTLGRVALAAAFGAIDSFADMDPQSDSDSAVLFFFLEPHVDFLVFRFLLFMGKDCSLQYACYYFISFR